MLIYVSGKGFDLSQDLRDEVTSKFEAALDKFSDRIAKVKIFLEDENGPKKGRDKSLLAVIDVERLPMIAVEEKGESWHGLIDQGAERVFHTASRQIERQRSINDRTSIAGKAPPRADNVY
jgi:ribosome-associated translation inhibitor RaiA